MNDKIFFSFKIVNSKNFFSFDRNAICSHMSCMDMSFHNSPWFSLSERSDMSMKLWSMSFGTSINAKSFYNSSISPPLNIPYNMNWLSNKTIRHIGEINRSQRTMSKKILIISKFNWFLICHICCSFFMRSYLLFISNNNWIISVISNTLITDNILLWHLEKSNRSKLAINVERCHFLFLSNYS